MQQVHDSLFLGNVGEGVRVGSKSFSGVFSTFPGPCKRHRVSAYLASFCGFISAIKCNGKYHRFSFITMQVNLTDNVIFSSLTLGFWIG